MRTDAGRQRPPRGRSVERPDPRCVSSSARRGDFETADDARAHAVGPPDGAASGRAAASFNMSRMASAVVRLNGTSRSFPPLPRTRVTRPVRFTSARSRDDQLTQAGAPMRRTAPGSRGRGGPAGVPGSGASSSFVIASGARWAGRVCDLRGAPTSAVGSSDKTPSRDEVSCKRPKGRQPATGRCPAECPDRAARRETRERRPSRSDSGSTALPFTSGC